MSQSSETTNKDSPFMMLGYPEQLFYNCYYTAQARAGIGVCIAEMSGGTIVQFFPWTNPDDPSDTGHARYAAFITNKATQKAAEEGELFTKWPFFHADNGDLLIIKCMVEEGLNQVEKLNELDPRSAANAAAGKALE